MLYAPTKMFVVFWVCVCVCVEWHAHFVVIGSCIMKTYVLLRLKERYMSNGCIDTRIGVHELTYSKHSYLWVEHPIIFFLCMHVLWNWFWVKMKIVNIPFSYGQKWLDFEFKSGLILLKRFRKISSALASASHSATWTKFLRHSYRSYKKWSTLTCVYIRLLFPKMTREKRNEQRRKKN